MTQVVRPAEAPPDPASEEPPDLATEAPPGPATEAPPGPATGEPSGPVAVAPPDKATADMLPARRAWKAAARELLLVAALFVAYKMGRLLTTGHTAEAMHNAARVWDLERLLRLPSEHDVQNVLIGQSWLVGAANSYYAYVHFPATIACLLWLYVRRRELYLRTRRILAGLTASALVLHVFFPLAPPRLASVTGLLDTGSLYGPAVYGPPDTDTLSNQYAAMPSLHVGWAVVVALALVAATRGRWRWLWLAHPVLTLLVVVGTGNHYWLDAIVVTVLLVVVAALVPAARKRARVPRPRVPERV